MGRKLTKSAKEKRKWKQRTPEKPAEIPDSLKHAAIEVLYRLGREPVEIIKLTGFRPNTVYDAVKRFRKAGSSSRRSKNAGRRPSVVTKENLAKVRHMIWRDNEMPIAEIARRLGIDKVSK